MWMNSKFSRSLVSAGAAILMSLVTVGAAVGPAQTGSAQAKVAIHA